MRSRVPREIRWTRHKTMEELLDDPLAESLYGLFLQVKDSPRHISISPDRLINEVYYISNLIYEEDCPDDCLGQYAHEIELDLGWKYAVDLVISMVYVILKAQRKNPKRIENMIARIEECYHHNIYWDTFHQLACRESPQKGIRKTNRTFMSFDKDISQVIGKNPIFIINNVEQLNAILGNNAKIQK